MIPKMLHLALLALMSTVDPSVQPLLCLDQAGCNADCLFIWLLHNMWWHNREYAIMPLALRSSMSTPSDIHLEDFPKLWQNSTYITWKEGSPGEDVGLAMTLVATCHKEFDTRRMVLDISDKTIIRYLALKVDDDEGEMTSMTTYSRRCSMWPTRLTILDSGAALTKILRSRCCWALAHVGLVWCQSTRWVCQLGAHHFLAVTIQQHRVRGQLEWALTSTFSMPQGDPALVNWWEARHCSGTIPPQVNWWNYASWPMTRLISHAALTPSSPAWRSPSSKRHRQHSLAQVVSLRSLSMTWPWLA